MRGASYAPVDAFAAEIQNGGLTGYAAPRVGWLPCAVELWAGRQWLATAAAAAFSLDAMAQNLRFGWCRFRLPLVGEGFALADEVTIRCAASGGVLLQLSPEAIDAPSPRRLGVVEMIAQVRRHNCADDVRQILPFAEAFRRRVGKEEFCEKAFATLIGRPIGFDEGRRLFHLAGDEDPAVVLSRVAMSREIRQNSLGFIPGPYHPDFRFGRYAFGDA